ncbi:hypothetical protein K2Z84_17450 [Candidatus Binatia bacterium]|nr:hypothetical protein [Candidatus Binatia bacterium]
MRAANARVRRVRGTVSRRRPETTQSATVESAEEGLLRVDEAVVHDLSHELGNYFHKLYYWTDRIRSGGDDAETEVPPADALDEALHRMQGFLSLALNYFDAGAPNRIAMRGGDVVKALEAMLHGENAGAAVEVDVVPDAQNVALTVDTNRLATGFRTIARLLGAGPGTVLRLEADVAAGGAGDVLRLTLSSSGGSPEAAARRAQRVVEWAVAARMLERHGGSLESNEQRPGAARCVLTLPLAR